MGQLHEDEIPLDVDTVRRVVEDALPTYADLPLRPLDASGSTNALFRLGGDLLVRVPRQGDGSADIDKEARWTPVLAPALPVAVPEVVAHVGPSEALPVTWSVVRWMEGEAPRGADSHLAGDLADLVRGLGAVGVPDEALADPELKGYRGKPLARIDAGTRNNLVACRDVPGLDLDLDALLEVWEQAMSLPRASATVEPRWLHGDLLAENLLVRDARLTAVLDLGALGVGDPAVDLICAWELLDRAGRAQFRTRLGIDDETWLVGRAWALAIAVMTFPYYWHSMPGRCASRLVMARAVLEEM